MKKIAFQPIAPRSGPSPFQPPPPRTSASANPFQPTPPRSAPLAQPQPQPASTHDKRTHAQRHTGMQHLRRPPSAAHIRANTYTNITSHQQSSPSLSHQPPSNAALHAVTSLAAESHHQHLQSRPSFSAAVAVAAARSNVQYLVPNDTRAQNVHDLYARQHAQVQHTTLPTDAHLRYEAPHAQHIPHSISQHQVATAHSTNTGAAPPIQATPSNAVIVGRPPSAQHNPHVDPYAVEQRVVFLHAPPRKGGDRYAAADPYAARQPTVTYARSPSAHSTNVTQLSAEYAEYAEMRRQLEALLDAKARVPNSVLRLISRVARDPPQMDDFACKCNALFEAARMRERERLHGADVHAPRHRRFRAREHASRMPPERLGRWER